MLVASAAGSAYADVMSTLSLKRTYENQDRVAMGVCHGQSHLPVWVSRETSRYMEDCSTNVKIITSIASMPSAFLNSSFDATNADVYKSLSL
jgi:hypothetical protein